MLAELQLNAQRETDRIVAFIRERLACAGFTRLVLGLSGGVDSAVVAALGVRAAGPDNVLGVLLPYRSSNPESEEHALLVVRSLGIPSLRWEITPMVQPLIELDSQMDARRKGNIMARCRMVALFDQSSAFGGLVAGTSNRTETLLGYFTLHGDGAAALKPIAHLFKCQVRQLARHLGVPDVIIAKAPSADLWQGQTDEGELGFTYDEADQVLYMLAERGLGVEETAATLRLPEATVRAVERRWRANAFKCEPVPVLAPANCVTP